MTVRCVIRLSLFFAVVSAQAHASPFHKYETVEIGGIRQSISLKGTDSLAPVLLFLHGGPGNSARGYDDKFTRELQKHFVVVQWDQRETQRTLELNHSDKALSVELMVNDAVEMIQYLSKRFSKKKIWLMGHSWGGFLALMVARRNPELLEGCFAVSPMIDQVRSERITLEWMIARAAKLKDGVARRELSTVKVPFETVEQLYFDRKWIAIFSGKKPSARSFVLSWGKTWFPLFSEASRMSLFDNAPEIGCPVFFLIGKQDIQTHHQVTDDYYKMLKAEKKELFWFNDSGHNLTTTDPARLQEIVISILNKN